jgi:hypothetical protein
MSLLVAQETQLAGWRITCWKRLRDSRGRLAKPVHAGSGRPLFFPVPDLAVAYAVSQRTREIGIRMSLGAQAGDLQRMFIRYGLLLAGVGAVLGLICAAGMTRLLSSLLFGVAALDVTTYVAVSALLIFTAGLVYHV